MKKLTIFYIFFLLSSNTFAEQSLSLKQATNTAMADDPWLVGNRQTQQALLAQSVAAATSFDPMISIGLVNMPLDSFAFNQEGMTQFKVGVKQKFGRGDSLLLVQQQLVERSEQQPLLRLNRQAQVKVNISELWLRVYLADRTIALIKQDRQLFEQLVDVAESSYASTIAKTRQQDVIRAQLELIRLDDRLVQLTQQRNNTLQLMNQWLPEHLLMLPWPQHLPTLPTFVAEFTPLALAQIFSRHPNVLAMEKNISAVATGIAISKQGYKPQWAVNASYGYRADSPINQNRADLFSVAVTFDLPLHMAAKQDNQVKAAIANTEAIKTQKLLLLKQMIAQAKALNSQLIQLEKRHQLYTRQLMPQTHQQAQAALNAYANDSGDFSEVMRARISELNTTIAGLKIAVEQQVLTSRLAYLFNQVAGDKS
ncbi:MAG: TolC family protein [Gammaproteobacteria bacterium]|nr:TolC family protein [Gammaproteobacteria bacterium]